MASKGWGVEWHSRNRLDGDQRYLLWNRGWPLLFNTRAEARRWIDRKYGYIRHREDLRSEPHGWFVPRPVKAKLDLRYDRSQGGRD